MVVKGDLKKKQTKTKNPNENIVGKTNKNRRILGKNKTEKFAKDCKIN